MLLPASHIPATRQAPPDGALRYNHRTLRPDIGRCAFQGYRCVRCNSYRRHNAICKPKTFVCLFFTTPHTLRQAQGERDLVNYLPLRLCLHLPQTVRPEPFGFAQENPVEGPSTYPNPFVLSLSKDLPQPVRPELVEGPQLTTSGSTSSPRTRVLVNCYKAHPQGLHLNNHTLINDNNWSVFTGLAI